MMLLVEDSPALVYARHLTGITDLINALRSNFEAMNTGQPSSGSPNTYGLVLFGKAIDYKDVLIVGDLTSNFTELEAELNLFSGRLAGGSGSLVCELGLAVHYAVQQARQLSVPACEVIVMTYSDESLLLNQKCSLINHPLLSATGKCGVHIIGNVDLRSSRLRVGQDEAVTVGITQQVAADLVPGQTQYTWVASGKHEIVNSNSHGMSLIRQAFSKGASVWNSRMVFSSSGSITADAIAGVTAYDMNKRMSRRCTCISPTVTEDNQLRSTCCECKPGTLGKELSYHSSLVYRKLHFYILPGNEVIVLVHHV